MVMKYHKWCEVNFASGFVDELSCSLLVHDLDFDITKEIS